jgi:polyphosphate kinase 2 (PPK2 family)
MYFQRYMPHFPAAGEITIFDRSYYNRAGVEHVMGFCAPEQHRSFLALVPFVERLEVGKEEQGRRFAARVDDPLRQWKLSPMDVEAWRRWDDYTRARDEMLLATDTSHAPWYIVRSDDKKKARLNCISHLLSLVPVEDVPREKIKLPKRSDKDKYDPEAGLLNRKFVPDVY